MNLSVTFLDALIVLIIVVSAGYAAWRGFLWETLTIFAWVAAAFGCLYFGPYVIPLARGMVQEAWLATPDRLCRGVPGGVHSLCLHEPPFQRKRETFPHRPAGPRRRRGLRRGARAGDHRAGLSGLYLFRRHPQPAGWLTQARLLPMVQSTAEVLLSVVPNHPGDYAFLHHDDGRRAGDRAGNVAQPPERHDPMADLIRQDGKGPVPPPSPTAWPT